MTAECIIFLNSTFSTVNQVLEAAWHMVAMQIARDPLVRQCVRQTLYERAKLKIKPTKKGKKVKKKIAVAFEHFRDLVLIFNNYSSSPNGL